MTDLVSKAMIEYANATYKWRIDHEDGTIITAYGEDRALNQYGLRKVAKEEKINLRDLRMGCVTNGWHLVEETCYKIKYHF